MDSASNFPGGYYPLSKTVHMFTDGACSGNPGPGAYACILQYKEHEKIISDYNPDTTNNIMELTAVIKGLESIKYPCDIEITSDSKYVVQGATEWLPNWKSNSWRTANKKPVANQELWQRLDELMQEHKSVKFHWIKGHNQHFYNCKCDKIATDLIKQHQNIPIDNSIETEEDTQYTIDTVAM